MNLNITELFSSVQGETSFAGLPTTFVRLSACNLRCTWCDTTYSFSKGSSVAISSLLEQIEAFGCLHVCVTGGEPLLQSNVHTLLAQLCDRNHVVSLETGGSLTVDKVDPRVHIILDIKCPGSGMSHKNYWQNLDYLRSMDEVKFVIGDEVDYTYARGICQQYNLSAKTPHILFSPVHGTMDPQLLVSWILRDRLLVRLNLQLHKYIWTPTTRGV